MALFDFLKKDDGNFFQWFEDAANNALQASIELRNLCGNFSDPTVSAKRLHEFEHRGDEIGHRIYAQLNKTFLTPLDREDIIQLYSAIDDVTDLVHSAADMMVVYKVTTVPPLAKDLADCIVGCMEEVVKALPYLRKRSDLSKMLASIIQINSLENKADDLLRDGILEAGYPRVTHPCATLLRAEAPFSFDLHVLGTPPAFALSQDQTLMF